MYRLYWDRCSANTAPGAVRREIGCGLELVHVDMPKAENRALGYLKLDPKRGPTLAHGDRLLYDDSAAIVLRWC